MPRKKQENKKRRNNKQEARDRVRPPGVCFFCKGGREPSFKEVEVIAAFITDRGRIVARERSRICAKHQRRLAGAIKQARHLGALPYLVRPEW